MAKIEKTEIRHSTKRNHDNGMLIAAAAQAQKSHSKVKKNSKSSKLDPNKALLKGQG